MSSKQEMREVIVPDIHPGLTVLQMKVFHVTMRLHSFQHNLHRCLAEKKASWWTEEGAGANHPMNKMLVFMFAT